MNKFQVVLRYNVEAPTLEEAARLAFDGLADFYDRAKTGDKVKLYLLPDEEGPAELLNTALNCSMSGTGAIKVNR